MARRVGDSPEDAAYTREVALAGHWDLILFPKAWGWGNVPRLSTPSVDGGSAWAVGLCTQFLLCFLLGTTDNMSLVQSHTFSLFLFPASQTPHAQCLTLPSIGTGHPLGTHSPSFYFLSPTFQSAYSELPALCVLSLLSHPQPLYEPVTLTASNPASTQALHSVYPSFITTVLNSLYPNSGSHQRRPISVSSPKGTSSTPPRSRSVGGPGAPPPPRRGPVGPAHPGGLSQAAGTGRGGGARRS